MKETILLPMALLALLSVSCGREETPAQAARSLENADRSRFLVVAVFEGLLEDGPDPTLFEPLLRNPDQWFVEKCPICWPVHDGIQAYVTTLPKMVYPAAGAGFPEDLPAALKSEDRKVRLKGIESLVDRYVQRRFDRTVMTAADRESMKNLLLMGKKYGTTVKQDSFGDFCPSCNGATFPKK